MSPGNDDPSTWPILCLWDYVAAFPSVSHDWMHANLRAMKAPTGLQWYVEILHFCNTTYTSNDGEFFALYITLSGVLQGCPRLGFLFATSIDCLLVMVEELKDPGLGRTRACADGIGSTLAAPQHLKELVPVFENAKACEGSSLKAKKCVLATLTRAPDEKYKAKIRQRFVADIPSRQEFKIDGAGKYLGFHVGPSTSSLQWKKRVPNGSSERKR